MISESRELNRAVRRFYKEASKEVNYDFVKGATLTMLIYLLFFIPYYIGAINRCRTLDVDVEICKEILK